MARSDSARIYAPTSYDDYLCLKPPLLLWVALLFLSRAITLPFAMGIGQVAGVSAEALAAVRALWSGDIALLPSLIAMVPLYGHVFPSRPQAHPRKYAGSGRTERHSLPYPR